MGKLLVHITKKFKVGDQLKTVTNPVVWSNAGAQVTTDDFHLSEEHEGKKMFGIPYVLTEVQNNEVVVVVGAMFGSGEDVKTQIKIRKELRGDLYMQPIRPRKYVSNISGEQIEFLGAEIRVDRIE